MSDPEFADIDRLSDAQALDLHALYQNEWWTRGRTLEETLAMLRHTDLLFGVSEKATGRLVAFARVLTDTVFKAFVFDVIVAPERRGRGLGTRLLRRIIAHPELRSVRHIDLACQPELTAYYERLGFTTELGGSLLMRRSRPA
ncbi:MAG TPA: GNAT family N-acetyltransferase [Candidatus Polarisedimenticolia bacterium]|nr:GNAT family N-acetyltransferase [Candidatus Polarisedimenticolia bacterium]